MTAVVEAQTAAISSSNGNGTGNGAAAVAGANGSTGGTGSKLHGYAFYESIGRPKFVIAPMVDQSELAWRVLSRQPIPPTYRPDLQAAAVASSSTSPPPASPPTTSPPTTSLAASAPTSTSTPAQTSQEDSTTATATKTKTKTKTPRLSTGHPIGGAHLVYTPMIHARLLVEREVVQGKRDEEAFNRVFGEEGSKENLVGLDVGDRPLFVQFAANDPDVLLQAAKLVEKHCDAVDINFGCPQGIAKRGNYGSFLQDDWDTIYKMINILHRNLSIPVTAKFRIFKDVNQTIEYAKMMESAGASILTCHGRTREMKGQMTGLADWQQIRAVKQAVKVPVFANGNILYREDVDRCIELTGVDGVMTAEGNLSNPCLFVPETSPLSHPPSWIVANHYLDIVEKLKTPTSMSAIRAHMFRMLRAGIEKHTDVRARLASGSGSLAFYRSIVEELRPLLEKDMEEEPIAEFPLPCHPETGLKRIPVWAAQPYVRPLPAGTYKAIKDANSRSAEGTATPGVLEDMLTGGTGEERVIAQDGTAAGLAQPLLPEAINCMIGGDPECKNIAAANCPRTACLTHCRAQGGLEAGRAENLADAVKLAQGGKLTGLGCEGHEEKDRARKQRKAEQKKAYQEHKAMRRTKRNRGKSVEGDEKPDAKKVKVHEIQPEEEAVNDSGSGHV